eukprot:scaffold7141_cov107-Isochrysis_galbana.AAC.8
MSDTRTVHEHLYVAHALLWLGCPGKGSPRSAAARAHALIHSARLITRGASLHPSSSAAAHWILACSTAEASVRGRTLDGAAWLSAGEMAARACSKSMEAGINGAGPPAVAGPPIPVAGGAVPKSSAISALISLIARSSSLTLL